MNARRTAALACALAVVAAGCGREKEGQKAPSAAPRTEKAQPERPAARTPEAETGRDPFTYSNYEDVRVTALALDADVLFDAKAIDAVAVLSFERLKPDASTLVLDTNDLAITSVEAGDGANWAPAAYRMGPDDPVLGSKLEIDLPAGASRVRIAYRTHPGAEGLQWLTPEQTAGKRHPLMYSQGQAINTRSFAPVQDTPAVRMTYTATIRTPPELLAVMSAEQDEGRRDGEYAFAMPQPVPAYLLALAVGDLRFQKISDTIGVYAEPETVAAAAAEFEDTPEMEKIASSLYGPYRWGRYDMLVLPQAFPFGGMENPRLSFLTPTLIAGDKSLVATVAHELAHSWSGNLVTNATWSDVWLNEGVTSYVENRVMEAVYGRDRAVMEQALSFADLKEEIAKAEDPAMTRLKLPSDMDHPDDAFSNVAYAKGQFFLHFLEARYGRAAFDAFLKSWFNAYAFEPATTREFRDYLLKNLASNHPDKVTAAEIDEWLYGEGIPKTAVAPKSSAFDKVEAAQAEWLSADAPASSIPAKDWTTQEWLYFINSLPEDAGVERLKELDLAFDLTDSSNAEIAFAWYMKAIKAHYAPATPAIEAFLLRVGRGKFVYPLYEALIEEDERAFAERVFDKARPLYHPIAQHEVEEILQGKN